MGRLLPAHADLDDQIVRSASAICLILLHHSQPCSLPEAPRSVKSRGAVPQTRPYSDPVARTSLIMKTARFVACLFLWHLAGQDVQAGFVRMCGVFAS
jgi:hypothetical protein